MQRCFCLARRTWKELKATMPIYCRDDIEADGMQYSQVELPLFAARREKM